MPTKQLSFDFDNIPPGMKLVFRPYRTLANGQVLWAKHYGLRAWPMLVPA